MIVLPRVVKYSKFFKLASFLLIGFLDDVRSAAKISNHALNVEVTASGAFDSCSWFVVILVDLLGFLLFFFFVLITGLVFILFLVIVMGSFWSGLVVIIVWLSFGCLSIAGRKTP